MIKGVFLAIALLVISGIAMAQRVVQNDPHGRAIIDSRAMPAKAITNEKKARTTDGTNSKLGTNDLNNIGSAESNKTVSHYFEVMKTDLNSGATMTWLDAATNCAAYNSGDGNQTWRLPTQRELQLIWVLKGKLNAVSGFSSFATSNYWSATEGSRASNSWFVDFSDGNTWASISKVTTSRVRCVRDITP